MIGPTPCCGAATEVTGWGTRFLPCEHEGVHVTHSRCVECGTPYHSPRLAHDDGKCSCGR